jgi:phosphoglycolate phosphatase
MSYSLAIFDFDGTVVDSYGWFSSVVNDVGRRYGFREVRPCELASFRKLSARQILSELRVPMWKLPAIAKYVRALKTESSAQISMFPDIPSVIELLAEKGVQLAIVSSDSLMNIRETLGEEMTRRFSIISGGVPIFGKAFRLHSVLLSAGVARSEAIYIGDEIRDLEAARKLRLAFGAVTWGYTAAETMRNSGATFVFERVGDIPRILETEVPA